MYIREAENLRRDFGEPFPPLPPRTGLGVTFEEAATVFTDPLAVVRVNRSPSRDERRMQIMGYSLLGRLRLVAHVEVYDEETIRIISARKLDPKERRRLERE
jgi:uncharacterized DUF497 family protein